MKIKFFCISSSLLLMILGVGLGILISKKIYEADVMTEIYLFSYQHVADLIEISNAIESGDMNQAHEVITSSLQSYQMAFEICFDEGEPCYDSADQFSFVSSAIKRIENHLMKDK